MKAKEGRGGGKGKDVDDEGEEKGKLRKMYMMKNRKEYGPEE